MSKPSNHRVSRRNFLARSIQTAAGAALATSPGIMNAANEPFFQISLAQWSLHRALFAKKLAHLDFAKAARTFGIDAVEYVNRFFQDKANDKDYLKEMKRRAEGEGVKSLLIMCDGEGRLGDPNKAERLRAVSNHFRWVEAAKFLGCHSIRVNAASEGNFDEQRDLAADGLRRLTEFSSELDIDVIVENHGGLSSNGRWLSEVMSRVDHPRCGTLPDFGNFKVSDGDWYDRYKGVEELMPFAKAVSAKSHEFDASGNDTQTDYFRMMGIVINAGYRSYVGIEYEGDGLDEPEGILATKRLLERVRDNFV
jgi:L-ribulose-5-phosphate 3-epimerase